MQASKDQYLVRYVRTVHALSQVVGWLVGLHAVPVLLVVLEIEGVRDDGGHER